MGSWGNRHNGTTPFGDRLKQERLRRDFSITLFEEKTGISGSQLTGYENRGVMPSVKNLVLIAQVLECSTDWLLGLED